MLDVMQSFPHSRRPVSVLLKTLRSSVPEDLLVAYLFEVPTRFWFVAPGPNSDKGMVPNATDRPAHRRPTAIRRG